MLRYQNPWWFERRRWFFTIAAAFIILLIEARLFSLQVINRPEFLRKAEANRIRAVTIQPTRGGIYDSDGHLLVENRPAHSVYAIPWIVRRNPETIEQVAEILDLTEDDLEKRVSRYGWYTFSPIVIKRDVSFSQLATLETIKIDVPGIEFGFEPKRAYPLPEAAHLLGYVGEPKHQASDQKSELPNLVGKHGLELVYDKYLRGKPGIRYIQVNASGKSLGPATETNSIPPEHGWDLYLNINGNLQRYAYDLLKGKQGAIVALNPNNGAVLCMLSLPDYDPTIFAGVMPEETWKNLINDPGHPLINRAVQGQYPPGSTYKMAILTGILEEGIATPGTRIFCGGGLQIGRRFFHCWKHAGHGSVSWKEAIQQSCDVFFYDRGMALGVDKMAEYTRKYGFGSKTGIDFDVENSGVAPDSEYLNRKYGKRGWTRGQAANISIGQGDVLATPMQLAVFTSAIASGKLAKPLIAAGLKNQETGEEIIYEPEVKPLDVSRNTLQRIRTAMYSVVNEEGGTAYFLRRSELKIAGKTGTSQNPHGEDHALFVAYAPFDNPRIAVSVMVEHGEHGSTGAAPLAVKLIERYLVNLNNKSRSLSLKLPKGVD